MSIAPVTLQGHISPEGRLQVDEVLQLPAGPVKVTVERVDDTPADPEKFWKMMNEIWDDMRQHGYLNRPMEEATAELNAMREEWAERDAELDAIPYSKTPTEGKPATEEHSG